MEKNEISVLLADDHTMVRKGIRSLLIQEDRIKITGEAENGLEALKKAETLLPEILVLDISLPLLNGLEVARQLNYKQPKIKIIILSMYDSEELINETLLAGVKGYLLKKAAPEQLVSAIYSVSRGGLFFSPEISKKIMEQTTENGRVVNNIPKRTAILTEREREILQLVVEGYSSRKIGKILFISLKTVENHRANIMRKLDIHNMVDLIKYALNKGIIPFGNYEKTHKQ